MKNLCILTILTVLSLGCAQAETADTRDDMILNLNELTLDKSCTSHDQCQVVPVGSKACGGPTSYVIYSSQNTDQSRVKMMAENITAFDRTYNADNDVISNCMFVMPPTVICQANTCQIVPE